MDYVELHLPSQCKPYGVEPGSIRIRPFKGKDEQLIAQMGGSNAKKKIVELLRGVVEGIEPEKLTIGDVTYILLWEASNSYTDKYPVQSVCDNCDSQIEVVVSLNEVNCDELPDDYSSDYTIEVGGKQLKMKLLTLADEVKIMDWAQRNEDTLYLYVWALSIVDEQDIYARMLMLEDMSSKDLSKIRSFHTKFQHGPDFIAPYTCPKCGFEGKLTVPFRLDEFIQNAAKS